MTYTNLHTTAALMTAKETELLTKLGLNDAAKIALKETQAKEQLKWDLQEAIKYEYDDTEFESYLTDNEAYLQEALANLQLHLYFTEQTGGAGSNADTKAKHYKQQYDSMKSRFANFLEYDYPRQRTVTIGR